MDYPCSENKDADQLRGYREADLRLCFRPCKLLVFSRTGSIAIYLRLSSFFREVCSYLPWSNRPTLCFQLCQEPGDGFPHNMTCIINTEKKNDELRKTYENKQNCLIA